MEPPAELRWDQLLFELLWIGPVVVGTVSVAYAGYSFRKREAITTVTTCFGLSVLVSVIGALCTWRSGLELISIVVRGGVSTELVYEGWRYAWWPFVIAGATIAGLLAIATAARLKPPVNPSERTAKESAILTTIIPLLVTTIIAIVFALNQVVGVNEFPAATYPLMALLLLSYYLLPTVGIPYVFVWGLLLYKWRSREPETTKRWWIVATFFIVFALLACTFTTWFYYAAWKGFNPLLP